MLIDYLIISLQLLFLITSLISLLLLSSIHAVLLLVLSFIIASILIFIFDVDFFGTLFIIIYVGAIAILFLFVVMLSHNDIEKEYIEIAEIISYLGFLCALPFGLVIGHSIVEAFAIIDILESNISYESLYFLGLSDYSIDNISTIQIIGQLIFKQYLHEFFLTGFLLLVPMILCIFLTNENYSLKENQISENVSRKIIRSAISISLFKKDYFSKK